LSDLFLRYGRARGTFNDPNVLGAFLIFPMLIAMGRIFAGRRGPLAACALVALFASALLLSFSRGAWGQAVFAALLMMVLSFLTSRSGVERLRILLIACVGVAVLAGLIVLLLSFDSVAALFAERASFEQGYDVGQFGRFGRHVLGALLALDHPLGLGPLWGGVLPSRRYVALAAGLSTPPGLAPHRGAALSTGGRSVAQPG